MSLAGRRKKEGDAFNTGMIGDIYSIGHCFSVPLDVTVFLVHLPPPRSY